MASQLLSFERIFRTGPIFSPSCAAGRVHRDIMFVAVQKQCAGSAIVFKAAHRPLQKSKPRMWFFPPLTNIGNSASQICTLVMPPLDYCKGLLTGLPSCRTSSQQSIQNAPDTFLPLMLPAITAPHLLLKLRFIHFDQLSVLGTVSPPLPCLSSPLPRDTL